MRKLMMMSAAAVSLAAATPVLLLSGHGAAAQTAPAAPAPATPAAPPAVAPAPAAAPATPAPDSTGYYVNIVNLSISPASMTKFGAALNDDVSGAMSEAGVDEINPAVGLKDANQVFIYEVYNDVAAWNSHQKTVAYIKFIGVTMIMIKAYSIDPYTSVVINKSTTAQPATGPLFIDVVGLDIVPAQFDSFMVAAKANAALSVQEPGVRESDIAVSQKDPNHVLVYSVYDNSAAHDAHVTTGRFKAYVAANKAMIGGRTTTAYTSVSMNSK